MCACVCACLRWCDSTTFQCLRTMYYGVLFCSLCLHYICLYVVYQLQNQTTPVHLAAVCGHVQVLRVCIDGCHTNKMVKAMVNECIVCMGWTVCLYPFLCLCIVPASLAPLFSRMAGCPSTMLLMMVTLR